MIQNEAISDDNYHSISTSSPTTSINVTRLDPYTNYTIHVRAVVSATTLENVEQFTEDLVGAADIEVLEDTHGTTPDNPVVLDEPLSGPSSSTIDIQIPDTNQIETGRVL